VCSFDVAWSKSLLNRVNAMPDFGFRVRRVTESGLAITALTIQAALKP
jgi:hypothetical protein